MGWLSSKADDELAQPDCWHMVGRGNGMKHIQHGLGPCSGCSGLHRPNESQIQELAKLLAGPIENQKAIDESAYWNRVEPGRPSNTGYLYLVSNPITKQLKIGYSSDPPKRLKSLQTASGVQLQLLDVIPGSTWSEAQAHRAFAELHESGEWFEDDQRIRNWIVAERASGHHRI